MHKISYIKSDDRKYNIERCLSLIKSEIISGLKNAKRIVVKPNCVHDSKKYAATNVEAIDALLEFIKPYSNGQITLAEGSAAGNTLNAFKNFDYLSLQEKYDLAVVDLNQDEFETIPLLDKKGKEWDAQIAKTITQSDYLISICPPKTHNETVYTGVIKNVAVGPLLRSIPSFNKTFNKFNESMGLPRNNKVLIHQGHKIINENIKRLYKKMPAQLAVIDGYEAMEGDGPTNGELVPAHFAITSSDPIAADWLACNLMSIDITDVGYLNLLSAGYDFKDVYIAGDDWAKNIIKFKMHSSFEKIRNWQ